MPGARAPGVLALTMGEPAGIGAEIALKAWASRQRAVPAFALLDDPERMAALSEALGLGVPIQAIAAPEDAAGVFPQALPVVSVPLAAPVTPGHPSPANAPAVIAAIDLAVAFALSGRASGVVTNPIQKESLYGVGFDYPGHTEYLAELAGGDAKPVMMLACPGLRVVPVTIHLSLRDALDALSREAIVTCGAITAQALRADFGIANPRIAVAALNPHAGEGGAMGREENEIIEPAVATLRGRGIDVIGPAPADSLFHEAARQRYDAGLCMYHDQALIPLKTVDFDNGVNITLGLPFVRTSPDHGTALNIAGRGAANPSSLIAALVAAAEIASRRRGAALPVAG